MTERPTRLFLISTAIFLALCAAGRQAGSFGSSPIAVSAHEDKKLAGGELFASSGCAHCHAADGTGTDDGPSLRDVRKHLKPDQIADQIKQGGKAMPAFGDSLDDEKISDLVAFLDAKKWKVVPAPPAPAQPNAAPAH